MFDRPCWTMTNQPLKWRQVRKAVTTIGSGKRFTRIDVEAVLDLRQATRDLRILPPARVPLVLKVILNSVFGFRKLLANERAVACGVFDDFSQLGFELVDSSDQLLAGRLVGHAQTSWRAVEGCLSEFKRWVCEMEVRCRFPEFEDSTS